MSLIVAGATGAVGRELVIMAVESDFVSRVVALSRRDIPFEEYNTVFGAALDMRLAKHKLIAVKVDWEKLTENPTTIYSDDVRAAFTGHNFAAQCMGTTRKDAGGAAGFKRVDYDYTLAFMDAVKAHSGSSLVHFAQVSSESANPKSFFLYMETKGKSEDAAIERFSDAELSIWRPGLLARGDKTRFGEKVASLCITPMPVAKLALAIVHNLVMQHDDSSFGRKLQSGSGKHRVYHNADIYALCKFGEEKTESN